MDLFNRKKKRRLEMAQQGMMATSKTSLKLQCLFCAKGDLKEAKELYDFFAADMPDLPDTDPVPATWVDNTKSTVNGLLGWFKENQDTIAQVYDFAKGVMQKKGALPAGNAAGTVTEALPPING